MSIDVSVPIISPGGGIATYPVKRRTPIAAPLQPAFSRVAFAAAHVVAKEKGAGWQKQSVTSQIDWNKTIDFRCYLWKCGLHVAEAMDTAQRGGGLDWSAAKQLIRLSCEAKNDFTKSRIACGVNTDSLEPGGRFGLDDIVKAYVEQLNYVEACGGQAIIMSSRHLAASAQSADDYTYVYRKILNEAASPVILHWLGGAFDPQLDAYWGAANPKEAMRRCLDIIALGNVDGVKISLLDKSLEIEMRRKLPAGVRMYTGDDFHFDELIQGDSRGYSDALLGIFDPIAAVAAAALQAHAEGDLDKYHSMFSPAVALSKKIFEAPTYHYKTGVVFLAYLNGQQDLFEMIGGHEVSRSAQHLSEVFCAADAAGVLLDPELASRRYCDWLRNIGIL